MTMIPAPTEKERDQPSKSLWERLVLAAPPWLFSFFVHSSFLLLLTFLVVNVRRQTQSPMEIEVANAESLQDDIFADTLGEQLEVPGPTTETMESIELSPDYAITDLPPVPDPFAAPPKLDVGLEPGGLSSDVNAKVPGMALHGRSEGMKPLMLKAYGGTALTEEAVSNALEWLRRNQRGYGDWSLRGPYADGASIENKVAATAMAMMAFEGAGYTHKSGKYKAEMDRALRILLRRQDRKGAFYNGESRNHRPYTEAMAMIAICELYAMTEDETLREPAQKAVDYAIKSQGLEGGWRYDPRTDSDTSVTGWYLMGLQSARLAGIDVPSEVFERVQKYLDLAAVDEGSRYSYIPGSFETPSMTAEGLLCRQYLGWRPDDPQMLRGVDYILSNPMDWSLRDTYYWYYATQTLFHLGGYPWEEWNRQLRVILPERQEKVGDERGSWTNHGDRWGSAGGRLFVTCLSTYMLEVYYRRMPLYSPIYDKGRPEPIDRPRQ